MAWGQEKVMVEDVVPFIACDKCGRQQRATARYDQHYTAGWIVAKRQFSDPKGQQDWAFCPDCWALMVEFKP